MAGSKQGVHRQQWLHAVFTTTDFRMADAHADAPSRACPGESDESAVDARAGTALSDRCDGDGERQLVWGSDVRTEEAA